MVSTEKNKNSRKEKSNQPQKQSFWLKIIHDSISKIILGIVGLLLLGLKFYFTNRTSQKSIVTTLKNENYKHDKSLDYNKRKPDNDKVNPVDSIIAKKMHKITANTSKNPPLNLPVSFVGNKKSHPVDSPAKGIKIGILRNDTVKKVVMNECDITAIQKYSTHVNELSSVYSDATGEILVYTYCENCKFKVKVDNEEQPFDVIVMPKKPTFDTYGYLPNEYTPGKHIIEIIDKKNNCHRIFPAFTVKGNMAIHICISENP